jgi:two-component system, OmpR family, sensor histidine kinase ArlS
MNILENIKLHVFQTIKFRLTVWYILGLALLVAAFGGVSYKMLSRDLYKNLDDSLEARGNELQASIKVEGGKIRFKQEFVDVIIIFDADGALSQKLGPNVRFANIEETIQQALFGQKGFVTAQTNEGDEVRLYAMPYNVDSSTRVAILVGRLTRQIRRLLSYFKMVIIIASLAVVILAGIGGLFLANRTLKQVDHITDIAREIGEGDLSRRIDIQSEDEMGKLASTLNWMISRLETAFRKQRQFAADASHELRTPLAIIQAESSLSLDKRRTQAEYRKSLELVSQEVSYMAEIIGKLLLLARSESPDEPASFQEVNVRDLLTELSSDMESLAQEKGLAFSFGQLDNLTVKGDRLKLRQLFLNILDNAIRYTPSGGAVSGSLVRKDSNAFVTVCDTGVGIPPEHLPHIFDRFYRVDTARSRGDGGSGLGLAIASSIVKLHGGEIQVESQVGKGSAFYISLPLSDAPQALLLTS